MSDKPIVLIDPGHGGKNSGAVYGGLKEKDINMEISEWLCDCLESYGINAPLTRSGDYHISLSNRASMAKMIDADLLVSIHCNAFHHPSANGMEVFYNLYNESRILAAKITSHFGAAWQEGLSKLKPRDIKTGNHLKVLRKAPCPAVLVECFFMSNPGDMTLYRSTPTQFHRFMSINLCEGIVGHFEAAKENSADSGVWVSPV